MRRSPRAAVAAALWIGVAVAWPALAEDGSGAAGSVESGMEKAGSATKDGLDKAGTATGEALDKAMNATGRGIGYAIEKTGEGFKKAGDAMTGSGGEPTGDEPD